MSAEDNIRNALWILESLDPETADAFDDDLVYIARAHPESLPAAQEPRSKEYVLESFRRLKESMGGLHRTIDRVTAEGDHVVVEAHNVLGNRGIQVFDFENGKVIRWRTYEDTAYMNTHQREKIVETQGRD